MQICNQENQILIVGKNEEMNKYDFYKEWYFHEIDRYFKISNSLTIPIGLVTLTGSIIYYFIDKLTLDFFNVFNSVVNTCFMCAILFWLASIYYLIRTRFGGGYSYLPTPNSIEKYEEELFNYNESQFQMLRKNNDEIQKEIEHNIIKLYIECIEKNVDINDNKSYNLYQSMTSIVYTIVVFFFVVTTRFLSIFFSI